MPGATASPAIGISPARSEADIASARELFGEYAESIGVDLEYQGFSSELAGLPAPYAPPSGDLLLARADDELVGCVAFRALDRSTAEMKRLYVRPSGRGMGLGGRLVEATLSAARQAGYDELRLDTLANMEAAQALYRAMGFVEIPPYGGAHRPGTRFFALSLVADACADADGGAGVRAS
jgi:ribosomal protein S18 acetylase RimI-like enzyme